MANQAALFAALRSFATRSVQDYDLDAALEEVGQQTLTVLDLDGAGITLKVAARGRPTNYISATDPRTLRVEREQDALGEGPCADAIAEGSPVVVSDLHAVSHWPRYTPVALESNFRAVAGIPMFGGELVVGALNCYATQPREWPKDDLEAAQLLANVSSAHIANAASYADQAVLAKQLQHALDSRVLIEQAKGVIAERHRITMEEAFEALRAHARNQGAKVHDVAADVLTGRQAVEP